MTGETATPAYGWNDDHVARVQQAFGLALHAATAMEKSIHSLFFHQRLTLAAHQGRALEREPAWEKAVRKPLKDTIRAVAHRLRDDSDLDTALLAAADRRNYLAHDFWWDNTDHLFARGPRSRLLAQLDSDTHHFHALCLRVKKIDDALHDQLYGRDPNHADNLRDLIRRASSAD
ncbi:hypothetical protein ACWGN5_00055 [Streptomyces sp. NPDC055815]